jgi:hypothetical protein
VPARGEFYRLVADDPPTEADFRNHLELAAVGACRRYWSDDCQAAGLSVSGDMEEATYLRESTGPMRTKKIARGDISGSGRLKRTTELPNKQTHHTWWRQAGDMTWQRFQVVA